MQPEPLPFTFPKTQAALEDLARATERTRILTAACLARIRQIEVAHGTRVPPTPEQARRDAQAIARAEALRHE